MRYYIYYTDDTLYYSKDIITTFDRSLISNNIEDALEGNEYGIKLLESYERAKDINVKRQLAHKIFELFDNYELLQVVESYDDDDESLVSWIGIYNLDRVHNLD